MKRLVIVFASITLVATSTSSVIACNARQTSFPGSLIEPSSTKIPGSLIGPSTKTNQGVADDIKTSINKAIQSVTEIKISKNYSNLKDPATIATLNEALQEQAGLNLSGSTGDPTDPTANPPTGEWADLSYSLTSTANDDNLTPYSDNIIQINIKVGTGASAGSASVNNVKCHSATQKQTANKDEAQAIAQKVNAQLPTQIDVPSDTNRDTTTEATRTILNTELAHSITSLTGTTGTSTVLPTGDWSHITYEGQLATPGSEGTIKMIITEGNGNDQYKTVIDNIKVTVAQTNQQIANAIAGKINNKTIMLPDGTNTDLTNPNTKNALEAELRTANPSLTTADLKYISFQNGPLATPGTAKDITVAVNVNETTRGAVGQVLINDLSVKITNNDLDSLKAFRDLMTQKNITLPYGKEYEGGVDHDLLLAKIEAANPALKNYQPPITFTFNGTIPLEATTATTIPTTLSLNGESITVDINFRVNNTWKQVRSVLSATGNFSGGISKIGNSYFLGDRNTANQGLFRSSNGTNWTKVLGGRDPRYNFYNPPVKIGNQTYVFPPNSTTYYYSGDGGQNWFNTNNGNLGESHFQQAVQIGTHWYIPTTNNGLLRGNVNSQSLTGPISGTQGLTGRSYPTEINNKIYWNTSTGVYVSDDDGTSFKKVTGGLPTTWDGRGQVSEIDGVYYAASANDGLWKSPDGMDGWNQNGIPQEMKQNVEGAPIKIDNTLFLPGYTIGLWTKKNDGDWTLNQDIGDGISVTDIQKLNGTYYCTTNRGLYTSNDGEHWQQNMTSALNGVGGKIPYQIGDSYYFATGEKGLWTIPIV